MLAAGDTFLAAAIEQLKIWGERTGAAVVAGTQGGDAAGVAYDALAAARAQAFDVLIVDTAGRLQNKAVLMDELGKIVRVARKLDSAAPDAVLLVLDATVGQNARSQVEEFFKSAGDRASSATKLDGTARAAFGGDRGEIPPGGSFQRHRRGHRRSRALHGGGFRQSPRRHRAMSGSVSARRGPALSTFPARCATCIMPTVAAPMRRELYWRL
jgi:hypothetical protein